MNKNDVPTRRSATTGPQILLEMPFKRMKASLQTTLSIKFCRLSKFKNILFFFLQNNFTIKVKTFSKNNSI